MRNDTLKELNTVLRQAEQSAETTKIELNKVQKEYVAKKNYVEEIRKRISKLTNKKLTVSEHAILRYLERIENIDLKEIESKIATDKLINLVSENGDMEFTENGITFVIKNNVVLTIKVKEKKEKPKKIKELELES